MLQNSMSWKMPKFGLNCLIINQFKVGVDRKSLMYKKLVVTVFDLQ